MTYKHPPSSFVLPGQKAVVYSLTVMMQAYREVMNIYQAAGERPVALLGLAACIIETHNFMVGDDIENTMKVVRAFAVRLRAGRK